MNVSAPSTAESLAFYKSAIAAAAYLDQQTLVQNLLGPQGDSAWRAYGDDLPLIIRVDTVLRNLAILYPAAFAPGPIFNMPGWYDDAPRGVGFERPPKEELEALWRQRPSVDSFAAALDVAAKAWRALRQGGLGAYADKLTPKTSIIAAGCGAVIELALAFANGDNLELRSQVLLVSSHPASRQLLGLACAMEQQSGMPKMLRPDGDTTHLGERASEAGVVQAQWVVISADASDEERQSAHQLGQVLNADQVVELRAD